LSDDAVVLAPVAAGAADVAVPVESSSLEPHAARPAAVAQTVAPMANVRMRLCALIPLSS
jgi:hypothetical protein